MNFTQVRLTLAALWLVLGTVAGPADGVPVFRVNERAFGSPGCLPETTPHLSIHCNPAILLPNGEPAIGHYDVQARAEGQVGPRGLELGMFAHISAVSPFVSLFPGPRFLSPLIIAQVSFQDLVTLTAAGVPHGDPISPLLTFSVTGFTCIFCIDEPVSVGPNFAPPHSSGTLSVGLPVTDVFTSRTFTGPTTVSATLDVLNGVPFSLQVLADATISVDVDTAHLAFGDFFNWESRATADFSRTVRITGIDGFDTAGNRISDFTLTSSNGQSLLSAAAAVPEPATAWLIVVALVVLGLRTGKRP